MNRILMIAPLPPPVHGSAMMTQYIKDSQLVNQNFRLDWVNLSTSRKIDEIGKGSVRKLGRFISSYFKAGWKLLTNKYDICYLAITCHGIGFLKDFPFIMLCKLLGRRIVIHQHNRGMSKDVDKAIFHTLFKWAYNRTFVILLSRKLYPDIQKIVNKEQVTICPNGIPQNKLQSKATHETPRILFLSNLIESKGVITLLDSCKILKDSNYKFKCDFIGGETDEINQIRFESEVKTRGLSVYVQYLGRKYGDEKDFELASCDIFVFPTNYSNECFPLVLLEAMQQKCAIITTNIGGIPDIIVDGKSGLITKPDNAVELAEKIKLLLDSPEKRMELGTRAFEDFQKSFTQTQFEKNICNIFKSVLQQN